MKIEKIFKMDAWLNPKHFYQIDIQQHILE